MVETRIILAGLWAATMLTYLLRDVLRIFAGDFEPGKIAGVKAGPGMYLGIAAIMLVPIVMLVLTLTVPLPAIRWLTLILTVIVIIYNLFGLPYEGAYDNFLIIVSSVFDGLILWHAWNRS